MLFLCVFFSFQIACLVPIDQFQLYKRLKFERGANFCFLLPSFFRCQWRQQCYMLQRQGLLGETGRRQRIMSLESLRAITRSDCAPKTNLRLFQWNWHSGILLKYRAFIQASGQRSQIACLRLHCSSQHAHPGSLRRWLYWLLVVETGAGCTWSFHMSIGIFRTCRADRSCSVMGIFANVPAREIFSCRNLMCVHLVYFICSWEIVGPFATE